MGTFESSAVGDVVTLVQEVEGEVKKLPAIITKLYENAHGDLIADLHTLASNVLGIPAKENATDEVSGTTGVHVETPASTPDTPPAAAQLPAVTAPVAPADTAPVTDTPLSAEESAYSAMSPEDRAAFAAFLASLNAPTPLADGTVVGTAVPPVTSSPGTDTTG